MIKGVEKNYLVSLKILPLNKEFRLTQPWFTFKSREFLVTLVFSKIYVTGRIEWLILSRE